MYQEDELHVYNVLDLNESNPEYFRYKKLLDMKQDRCVWHDKVLGTVNTWIVYAIVKASNPMSAVYKYLNGCELGVDL